MYDIAVIGAGVTGCAIARELSRYQAGICVIEREEDVCCGTSKANSAIIHAGFDAKPGTLKAKLNVEGNAMMDTLSKDLDIPFVRNGSLVVCTDEQDASELERLLEQGKENGVKDLRILDRKTLHTMEPNLDDHVTSALYAPTGGIVCPFHMTIAFAENAVANGVEFFLNTAVTSITSLEDGYLISTDKQDITAKTVINAAGVYADVHFFFVTHGSIVHVEHVVAVFARSFCQPGEIHSFVRLFEYFSFFPSDNVVVTESFEKQFDGAFATYFEDYSFVRACDILIPAFQSAQIGVGICVGSVHVDVGHAHAVADFLDGDFEVVLCQGS